MIPSKEITKVNKKMEKKIFYYEKYHDNCHDYLKALYVEKYAMPQYKKLLYQIKEKIPKINICNDTDEHLYTDIIICDQHAVIFAHHADIFFAISTYALNACVALVLYISEYKIGCMTHFDGLPAYSKTSAINDGLEINFDPIEENMKIILRKLRNLAQTNITLNIDYYLIGGIFGMSEVMINDIIACVNRINKNEYRFTFKGRNILGPENQSRNICLNTRNGKITYFDYVLNSEIYVNNRNDEGLPMNIIKAPRKSEAFLDITYEPVLIY